MSGDSSSQIALTLVRGSLVIAVAGALACVGASTQLPFLTLHVEALHSSIDQGLWSTHVHTPLGYRDVRAINFWKCDELVSAFKGAQAATFLAIVFASVGFLFAIFNVAGVFTTTTQRVRWVCGAPLLLFLLIALLGTLVTLAITNEMYERDWCTRTESHLNVVMRNTSTHRSASMTDDACDPFDGCVRSFKDMGFYFNTGQQAACAASIFLTIAIFCELLVFAAGGSHDDEGAHQSREGESAVSLLTSRGRPNNDEQRDVQVQEVERLV